MWRACPKNEEKAMWRIFQGNRAARETSEITVAELSVLLEPLSSSLIILDLRRRDDVDRHPYRSDLKFYALSGELRTWWRDDLELETVEPYAGGLRARQ
jgi:hypothetical protein